MSSAPDTVALATTLAPRPKSRPVIIEVLKNLTMAGGFFALTVVGAGSMALFGGAPTGLFAYLP